MPQVTWSAQAGAELEALVLDAAVRERIRRHAEAALRCVVSSTDSEGAEDGIMWRRAIAHEKEELLSEADDDGAQACDYFLLYREAAAGFEIMGVRSTRQIASREVLYRIFGHFAGPVARSA